MNVHGTLKQFYEEADPGLCTFILEKWGREVETATGCHLSMRASYRPSDKYFQLLK